MYMRRSKLDTYEAILGALVKRSQKIDMLAYKVNLDCIALKRHLVFLMQNGLIEELILPKGTFYSATERGASVFKTLDFQKYFKRIQNTLVAIDESMKVISTVSKNKKSENESPDEKY